MEISDSKRSWELDSRTSFQVEKSQPPTCPRCPVCQRVALPSIRDSFRDRGSLKGSWAAGGYVSLPGGLWPRAVTSPLGGPRGQPALPLIPDTHPLPSLGEESESLTEPRQSGLSALWLVFLTEHGICPQEPSPSCGWHSTSWSQAVCPSPGHRVLVPGRKNREGLQLKGKNNQPTTLGA